MQAEQLPGRGMLNEDSASRTLLSPVGVRITEAVVSSADELDDMPSAMSLGGCCTAHPEQSLGLLRLLPLMAFVHRLCCAQ